MKTLKLEIPEGYEIDKEKSTFENIILKKIEKKRPLSVKEIKGREWFITGGGSIDNADYRIDDLNNLSTKERAEAFLALMQLVELRDAWNDGWKWEGRWSYAIIHQEGRFKILGLRSTREVLCFKNSKTAKEFLETFRDLIETAKELI